MLLINWLNLASFENIWLIVGTMSCYLNLIPVIQGLAITISDKKYFIHTFQGKTEKGRL